MKAWAGLSQALKQRCLLSATAVLVEDIQPGGGLNNGTESSAPGAAVDVSGTTYFVANDGINGAELWRISAGGTAQLVEDSIPGGGIRPGAVGANSSQLTNVSGVFYFSVDDGAHGQELWRINGNGTAVIVDGAVPGEGIRALPQQVYSYGPGGGGGFYTGYYINQPGGSLPENLTNVNGTLYFSADDGLSGRKLWKINLAGTGVLVEDSIAGDGINPVAETQYPMHPIGSPQLVPGSSNPQELTVGGGINPGTAGSDPLSLTTLDSTLFFVASNSSSGQELWRINSAGTAELVDNATPDGGIASGGAGSSVRYLTPVSGSLYFTANDGTIGQELWNVGPTGIATLIEDAIPGGGIAPGSSGGSVAALTNVSGILYFVANDAVNGSELWKVVSGTTAVMVEDSVAGGGIAPGNGNSSPYQLTNLNETLYFSAIDGVNGQELWRVNSLGIAELVEDSVPGVGLSAGAFGGSPDLLSNAEGVLYFSAQGDASVRELWRVNSAGIAELVNAPDSQTGVNPGPQGSNPGLIPGVGSAVYFAADDGISGRELWKTTTTDVVQGTAQSDLITITYTPAGWQVTMKTGNAPIVSFPLFPLTLTLNVPAFGGEDTIRVVGTAGDDTYVFGATLGNETDRVTENPNEGTDALNFAGLSIPLTLNLSSSAPQGVHAGRTLILNLATFIENAVGTSASDQIIGNAAANGLDGRGGNDKLIGSSGRDVMVRWGPELTASLPVLARTC